MQHLLLVVGLLLCILQLDAQSFKSGIITGLAAQVSGDGLGGFHKVGFQLGGL